MSFIAAMVVSAMLAVAVVCLVIAVRYYHYRFVSFVRHEHTADMDSRSPEGYSDKQFYYYGETITFFLRSNTEHNTLCIRRMSGPLEYREIYTSTFGLEDQAVFDDVSDRGCAWKASLKVTVGDEFTSGYYHSLLANEESGQTFGIYFIVGDIQPGAIVVVAPVSTWAAYNSWGGRSLYQNKSANKTVYDVSTERPNTAFEINHAIDVEANIFNWFAKSYSNVSVIPDYLLEDPRNLKRCRLLILGYHCEYISMEMHQAVRAVIERGISVISLGANQLYWVVRWNAEHTRMECRKDLTFFKSAFSYGGMWKHHFRSPKKYLGGDYNPLGMHTFAPYRLMAKKNHWIIAGLNIQPGDLFGMAGIDGKPICGAETDKAKQNGENLEIIAHGMNCESESIGNIYDPSDSRWDGAGGGDMTIVYRSNGAAVLNTASIHSGAGLGFDPVFTGIIHNFVKRYGSVTLQDTQ